MEGTLIDVSPVWHWWVGPAPPVPLVASVRTEEGGVYPEETLPRVGHGCSPGLSTAVPGTSGMSATSVS